MKKKLLKQLAALETFSIADSLHLLTQLALRPTGLRWEIRRSGNLKLGLWRMGQKRWSRSDKRRNLIAPRRFILIPGFGDSPLTWLSVLIYLIPVFRRNFDEVVVLDLPGFRGLLANEKCAPSLDHLFKTLGDVMDSLKPHTVCGHSLGGWVAAHYATECGETSRPTVKNSAYRGPEHLILVSPSGVYGNEAERSEFIGKFERAVELDPESLKEWIFVKQPLWYRWLGPDIGKFIRREDVLQFLRSAVDIQPLESRISAIRSKITLIWGEADQLTPSRWIQAWLAKIESLDPRSQILTLEGIGHPPHIEDPKAMASALKKALGLF